jgi:hypothetical protein
MEATLAGLNGMVSRYNGTGGILPEATLSGANLTVVPPIVPAATSAQTQSPAPTSGLVFRSVAPPPPPPAPVGPTEISIDVTGWSFLVLKWGEINYHFYVGDSSGVQTFKGTAPLASYSTFFAASVPVSVPDAGSSALLLAAGVLPLAVFRRRFRR